MAQLKSEDPFLTTDANDPLLTVEGFLDNGLLAFLEDFNDTSLISHLGIEPTMLVDDSYKKLLDSNVLTYTTPEYDTYNPITQNSLSFYTIDTEDSPGTVVDGGIVADSTFETQLTSQDELAPAEHITLTLGDSADVTEAPLIIHREASVQGSPVNIIETPTPNSPADEAFSPAPVLVTARAKPKGVKRCGRKTPIAIVSVTEKDEPPKAKFSRRQRPKKTKKYEIGMVLDDPLLEKKRLNAINAKKNREKKKDLMKVMEDKVSAITQERDTLQKEVEALKKREQFLREQLVSKYGYRLPMV